ncbi:MAG: E3 binding domain-containing protein, partial [Saprospiraceae bacterium]|nr:E3 binding domain-containing protein [Saprospiraceae bacterium]
MPVIELKIPNLGESISSVTFAKWLKPNGAYVEMDEPLCEIETEKANQELSADKAGKLSWVAKEGDDLEVGALFATIDTDAQGNAGSAGKTAAAATAPAAESTGAHYAAGHAAPAAAKILEENAIDPAAIAGTGKDGRITKEDALKAVEKKSAPAPNSELQTPNSELPTPNSELQ